MTIKVLTKNDTRVELTCPEHSSNSDIRWTKEQKDLPKDVTSIKLEQDGTLVVSYEGATEKERDKVYGNYSCKVGNVSSDYRVVSE